MLAEIERGRANQIAHVFDEDYIDVVERNVVQRFMNHGCVQVAGAAGCNLNCRYPPGANSCRIVLGFKIAFDYHYPGVVADGIRGGLEQSGFARTR